MGIPTGSYPKMVTGTDAGGRTAPLVYPAGDAKQYLFVIFNNAADEAAYANNGIAASSVIPSSSTHGNGWASGQWNNKGK